MHHPVGDQESNPSRAIFPAAEMLENLWRNDRNVGLGRARLYCTCLKSQEVSSPHSRSDGSFTNVSAGYKYHKYHTEATHVSQSVLTVTDV